MSYIQITAKLEEANESSYTIQSTGEVVSKVQLSLVVPGMRDRLLCELPLEKAPKPDLLDRWELEESWLVVSADGMRALAFERSNARAGEKPVGALVVFQAVDAREASPEERKRLQEARKAQKLQTKQRRAQRKAERDAALRSARTPQNPTAVEVTSTIRATASSAQRGSALAATPRAPSTVKTSNSATAPRCGRAETMGQ